MPRTAGREDELLCPGCGLRFDSAERFCPDCSLPLIRVQPGDALAVVSERHRQARKIKPQLAEGELVRVAGAHNLAEAEFIQGLLLEEGCPVCCGAARASTSRTCSRRDRATFLSPKRPC